jgi:hypothetical protein
LISTSAEIRAEIYLRITLCLLAATSAQKSRGSIPTTPWVNAGNGW